MKSRLQILTSTLMLIAGLVFLGINPANAQNSDSLRIDELEGRVKKIEGLKGLKVSGYIQGQYQYGDPEASLNVGTGNLNKEEGWVITNENPFINKNLWKDYLDSKRNELIAMMKG